MNVQMNVVRQTHQSFLSQAHAVPPTQQALPSTSHIGCPQTGVL